MAFDLGWTGSDFETAMGCNHVIYCDFFWCFFIKFCFWGCKVQPFKAIKIWKCQIFTKNICWIAINKKTKLRTLTSCDGWQIWKLWFEVTYYVEDIALLQCINMYLFLCISLIPFTGNSLILNVVSLDSYWPIAFQIKANEKPQSPKNNIHSINFKTFFKSTIPKPLDVSVHYGKDFFTGNYCFHILVTYQCGSILWVGQN